MQNVGQFMLVLCDSSPDAAAFSHRFTEFEANFDTIDWPKDREKRTDIFSIFAYSENREPEIVRQRHAALKEHFPHAAVAWAVPNSTSAATVSKLAHAGAVTVVFLNGSVEELRESIAALNAAAAVKRGQAELMASIQSKIAKLSDEERKVMNLMVLGSSNKSIASNLGIGLRTVEKRRQQVFRKLNAGSIPDVVRILYVEEGLLHPSIFEHYPLSGEITE